MFKNKTTDRSPWLLVSSRGQVLVTLPKFLRPAIAFCKRNRLLTKSISVFLVVILILSIMFTIFGEQIKQWQYKISPKAEALMANNKQYYGDLLDYDAETGAFNYNQGYEESDTVKGTTSSAKFSAKFWENPKKGIEISDAVNNVSIQITPKFNLSRGQKDGGRLVYPAPGVSGVLVITPGASGFKEDIILESYTAESLTFDYELALPTGLEARIGGDGALYIYGPDNSYLLGNVATGTEKDAQLLEAARQNAPKNTVLFTIPAPFIQENNKDTITGGVKYLLEGSTLKVLVEDLKNRQFPLTVDPSIYVETAKKLMRGNNETNVDFDTTNELIQKSPTTGARIDSWNNNLDMSEAMWGHATATAGGYIYRTGGRTGAAPKPQVVDQIETLQNSDSTSFVMNMPAVRPAGDLYIAVMCYDGSQGDGSSGSTAGNTISTPSGWTKYANRNGHAAYYKIGTDQGGGNESASYTFTGDNEKWGGVIMRVTGFDSSSPISGSATQTHSNTSTTPQFPAITPSHDNTLIIRAVGADNDEPSVSTWVPSNHTKIASGGPTGNNDCAYVTASVDVPPAAGVAQAAVSLADTAINDDYGSSSIAIKPASATITDLTSVNWAEFNSSSLAIESPNPGTVPCAGWCADAAYDLPQSRRNHNMVAYNGFLYVIGGTSSSCSGAQNACDTVYISKLGANGEPSLWHPTDSNKSNWTYWYASSHTITNGVKFSAAVAYNNRLYLLGGQTNSASTGITTVQFADLGPTGDISSWSTTGMQALPAGAGRFMHSAQVYNDVLYTVGGFEGAQTSSANLRATVYYSKLNSDGTMNPWVQTGSFTTARATFGGDFTSIWGAYLYLGGGCTAVNGSGYCTTVSNTMQLASINADGSLAEWGTILNLDNQRIGYSFASWQGGLYRLGGCQTQDTSSGECTGTLADVDYGVIKPEGEASTVDTSVASGASPCTGSDPYSCNMPTSSIGNMLNGSIILNGYLYIMGGCTNDACTTYSSGVSYVSVGSDGTLRRPAVCPGGSYTDAYCISPNSLPRGIGAPGMTSFNNRIYVVGGFPELSGNSFIYYVQVNNDGSLNTWATAVDMSTIGATDVSYTFAYTRANPNSASTNPGNLYIFGGCSNATGIGCSTYSQGVYKCDISTAGVPSSCTATGQLQIGTVAGASGTGLGAHAGTVYANYIYLMGGLAPGALDLVTVYFARFDDSNNVVNAATGLSTGSWTRTSNDILVGRRRGAGFGYNGHLYVSGGYDGTDALADIEFAKIDVSTGDIDPFQSSTVSINKRWGLTMPVSNSYAYVIGGCIDGPAPSGCNVRTDTIQTFQVYNNESGAMQSFTNMSDDTFAADTDRWGASAAILNGYLYIAGGCISATDCTNATNNVQYAAISATDGSIGTWATASNVLPADRAWGQLEVAGGYLYYLGGQDDTATNEQSTVYYAGTFSSGNITAAWATASGGIGDTASQAAQARTKFGATVWNNRIYVVGGLNGSAAVTNTVYISPQLNSGGNIAADSWTSDADVPEVARFGGAVTSYANNLYLFGGNDGTNYLNDSQFTQINSDGTVDAWTFTTSIPGYISQGDAFAANGYVYIVGGRSAATSCAPNTIVAPISANTTIATGNNPTGVGEWFETNVKYAGGRYGVALAYTQGKMYVMGGGCTSPQSGNYTTGTITQSGNTITGSGTNWTNNYVGATITYADASTAKVVSVSSTTSAVVNVSKTIGTGQTYTFSVARNTYGVAKAQPQVAKYSRMIDTDTDVFPNGWLLNGLDNSIGARWQARYRSAVDASNVVFHETFDNGTNSATLTDSSGGFSNFSSCTTTNFFTRTYDNSWSVTPSLSARFAVAGATSSGGCHAAYSTSGTRYERFYLRLNGSTPSANTTVYTLDDTGSGGSQMLGLQVSTTGTLRPLNNNTFTGTALTLDTTPVGNRIEVGVTGGSATVRVFSGSNINGTTPSATQTFVLSGDANTNDSAVGILVAGSTAWNWWIDDYKASQSTWVGPAFPSWGQETNVGDITLGDVMPYTPKDSNGTNTNFARYFYFFISIDASQTFGYPEDVNRGPTITDLSLFFTSDPGKRLRHGKTFTGGELQPLDTPCGQSADADCPGP